MKRTETRAFLWSLLIAAAVLFFCTKSSPGYPVNDWSDANIYLTIGRGMTRGQVVYRDLYDHKGPLLYALHALCALVSANSFLGVYIMEVLLGAAFLYGAYRVLKLSGLKQSAWAMLPVLALIVFSSVSFAEGDSAEEMALPLIVGTMAAVFAFLQSDDERMSAKRLVLCGALTGCVFWIKFTMAGLQAGLLLYVLIKYWRDLPRMLGWLIAGFALSTLPWIVYFGLNGALIDWLKVYLYDNLFLYSAGEGAGLVSRVKAIVMSGLDWLTGNLRYTLPILLGLAWFTVKHKKLRLCVWLMAAIGALGVFIGGKSYTYYGLALAPLAVLGLAAIGCLWDRFVRPRWAGAVCLAVCVALCPLISHNMTADYGAAFATAKEDTMQHKIAQHIPADASLLNYGFMDAGFFTAAGITPQVKYFHQTNVPLDEMLTEQARYIREGVCNYVVTRGQQPEGLDQYELIAEAETPAFWYEKVYLYRRRTAE